MDIASEVLRILDERGPSSLSDIGAALLERDRTLTATRMTESLPADALLVHEEYLVRESWLFDRVFTHRLTDAEAASDMVAVMPDFALVLNALDLGGDDWVLADGTPVTTLLAWAELLDGFEVPEELHDAEIIFAFPQGTFRSAGRNAGDLVGLRYGPGGFTLETPAMAGEVPPAIPESLDALPAEDLNDVGEWLWALLAATPVFRDPLPPVSEIIAASDVTLELDNLVKEGFDRDTYFRRDAVKMLQMQWGIRDDQAASVHALQELAGATLHLPGESAVRSPDEVPFDPALIAYHLSDPYLNQVAVSEVVFSRFAETDDIRRALDLITPSSRDEKAALLTLRGYVALRAGDHVMASNLYTQALAADPDSGPACEAMAMLESDRGNAAESDRLFQRTELLHHPMWEVVRGYLDSGTAKVGRNDPCPCGSGKKYKQCHLGKPLAGVEERGMWLSRKAYAFVDQWAPMRLQIVAAVLEDNGMSHDASRGNPLPFELLLFHEGYLEQFIEQRGGLLPADELETARGWLASPGLRLMEVLDTEPGRSLEVRDVATGEVLTIAEKTGSRTVHRGMFFVSRPAPVGQEVQLYAGFWPVSLPMRTDVLAALDDPEISSEELADLLTLSLRPPHVVSSDHEPLTVCKGTIDPRGDVEHLDDVFEPADDGWLDLDGDVIRAWIRIKGDHLELEAMTTTRFAQALALITSALPDAVVLGQSQEPLDLSTPVAAVPEPPDAEEPEVLEQVMREMERRWVDEPIPALEGVSPRHAAADPTRRDDLIRLLDSFPPRTGPGQMDPERLRALLDL